MTHLGTVGRPTGPFAPASTRSISATSGGATGRGTSTRRDGAGRALSGWLATLGRSVRAERFCEASLTETNLGGYQNGMSSSAGSYAGPHEIDSPKRAR